MRIYNNHISFSCEVYRNWRFFPFWKISLFLNLSEFYVILSILSHKKGQNTCKTSVIWYLFLCFISFALSTCATSPIDSCLYFKWHIKNSLIKKIKFLKSNLQFEDNERYDCHWSKTWFYGIKIYDLVFKYINSYKLKRDKNLLTKFYYQFILFFFYLQVKFFYV